MRKILLTIAVLLAAVSCGKKPAEFTGKITGLKPDSHVSIMNIDDPNNLIPVTVDEEGNYSFEIKDGPCTRYLIVDDPKGGLKFYSEPGMKANMDVEMKRKEGTQEETYETIVTYTGDNKDAYEFLTEGDFFSKIQNPILMEHYEAKDLKFNQYRSMIQDGVDSLRKNLQNVKSEQFRDFMGAYYDKYSKSSLGWFSDLTREADPDYKEYIESLDRNGNFEDAYSYMSAYSRFWMPIEEGKDKTVAWFEALNEQLTNKDIIRKMADDRIHGALGHAPANIEEVFNAYKAIEPERDVPEDIQALYDHYKGMVPGAPAVDFDVYDADGNKVMLSDMRGKALYIDCWATWCGPCRAQTPYMIKLYDHYKNDSRIQLVSISLDKNEKNWKAVVAEENLEWPQYIAQNEFDNLLCKSYDIKGIPRFLFFDKDGCILSVEAKRPSEPDIIEWIEERLK
ncbi:MAG: AhpC/TSA family protein [Bacteroidales bacterium]|nr:AhpC/TSA family protein [Bacteroidales bacterium]